MNRLDSYTPLGYSLCGVVVEVGAGAEQFSVGQLVAAAGNEFALHAEVNWVPTNLCVPVPDGVAAEHAAFATVGAIAMQGVRRAEVALGETACVIGLGLIGQLVVRLLVASGVQVVGLDVVEARCRAAEKAGALICAAPDEDGLREVERVLLDRTGGLGADHVLLAAGGDSNGPVEVAARLARDRARVVDIGKTRLDLPWNAYYEKELDVRFSRSYGPGRYDDRYELEGIDYPAGYVRWTERRNLACFLDLLADGSVDVTSTDIGRPSRSKRPPTSTAGWVPAPSRASGSCCPTAIRRMRSPLTRTLASRHRSSRLSPQPARRRSSTAVRLGFIGAGNYATSMLLPHLRDNSGVELVSVATTKALSGLNAQRKFGFSTMTTRRRVGARRRDPRRRLHRHAASLACQPGVPSPGTWPHRLRREAARPHRGAARRGPGDRGKDRQRPGHGRVQPAGLRRSSPISRNASVPPVARCRRATWSTPAGWTPSSWYLNEELEGSRFAGEGGHFIDTLSALVGHHPVEVHAMGAGESVHATLRFADGSVATISYVTDGSSRFPERDPRRGRRRPQRAAGQLPAGHRVVGQGKERPPGARRAGQGSAGAAGRLRRRRPYRFRDADLAGVAGGDHPRNARRRKQPVVGKAGGLVSRPSPGWYLRRLRGMSPTEVVYRTLDAGRRRIWARRQVQPGAAAALPPRHPQRAGLRVAAAGIGPRRRRPGRRVRTCPGRRRGPGRNLDRAGYPPCRQRGPGLVQRSGDRAPRA